MFSISSVKRSVRVRGVPYGRPRTRAPRLGLAVLAAGLFSCGLAAQTPPSQAGLAAPGAPSASPFQGSVARGEASEQPIALTLDDAIQRGLKANLGVILSGAQTAAARGQRLSQLQALLPSVDASIKEADMQVDLPAEGLRIPGFPKIIGPFGFTDLRANPDLVADRCGLAAQLPGRAAQLCRRSIVGSRCARTGGAGGGQCLPAGAGR